MKKIFLLCAMYVGLLNGMQESSYQTLPTELKQEIFDLVFVICLADAKIDEGWLTAAIIRKLSALHGIQIDMLLSSVVMNAMAKKFPHTCRGSIACVLGTKREREYTDLNKAFYAMTNNFKNNFDYEKRLNVALGEPTLEKYKAFIVQGTDPSYSYLTSHEMWGKQKKTYGGILMNACDFVYSGGEEAFKILEYLLEQGSNPNVSVITHEEKEDASTCLDIGKIKPPLIIVKTPLQIFQERFRCHKEGCWYFDKNETLAKETKVIELLQRYGAK